MKQIVLSLSLLILISVSCRKVPDFEKLSEQFLVSTSLDKNAEFSNYKTFFISDTVLYIGGTGADTIITGPNALQLVQTVKNNLISRGYTFVAKSSNPDLGLTLSAIKDINVVVESYPGWWDGYWGSCYWYYWCYPYYYPWTTVYTYSTGTVILNMYDLKNSDAKGQLTGIWNVTALGALGSNVTDNIALGVEAIDQGFVQSPYLKTN